MTLPSHNARSCVLHMHSLFERRMVAASRTIQFSAAFDGTKNGWVWITSVLISMNHQVTEKRKPSSRWPTYKELPELFDNYNTLGLSHLSLMGIAIQKSPS
jgi:hypothetical protein